MDPTPPAWLRSYKAHHASISPNYASQVRPQTPAAFVRPQTPAAFVRQVPADASPANDEKTATIEDSQQSNTEAAAASDSFAFQSTISLTLHNGLSLDKTYSNSTPNSSPQKASFNHDVEEKPAVPERKRPMPEPEDDEE
ncbi:MAG: hypothetical protein Q9174_004525 [Haloplaca sp. 1 TL-2023]